MAIYRVQAPDGSVLRIEGPDDASHEQVEAFAAQQFKPTQDKPYDAMEGISGPQRFIEGAGKAFADIGRGARQIVGLAGQGEIDDARKYDAPLMKTGAGVAGNVAGSIAAAAPTMLIPGANTVTGAALVGGAMNALQPTAADESRTKNTLLGAALGGAGQYGLGKITQAAGARLAGQEAQGALQQAQNAVKDRAVAEAKDAGYKTVPSISDGNLAGRLIEGATGKIKAAQLAAVKNQTVTDALARKALGLPEDAPLSMETTRAVRQAAAVQGYEPVRAIPRMATDRVFQQQIDKLTSRADNAAQDFGELVQSDIKPLADGLKNVKSFTGDTAVDAAAIFREKASDMYAQGNKTLGKAYREAAEAIESQIERGLSRNGKNGAALIKNFRDARTRMAQSFDVEKALREGQGQVDARVLGKLYAKNPDRMSGDLAKIGKAASVMPDVMSVPKAGWANPITALDSGFATFGGILAGNPAPLAYPLSRAAGRYGLMSGVGQKMFTTPNYDPGLLAKASPEVLKELERLGMGGLLGGSVYAAQ